MRTNYAIKNGITQFINNIVTFILLFITQSIFMKTLGVEYNGLNGLFSNVLTILNIFELGISNSITFNLYKYIKKNDKETIKSIMNFYKKTYRYIALTILIIGLLFIPFIHLIVKTELNINLYFVYILFLINTISTYFISYKRNLLYASQRKYVINIINLLFTILLNVLQIIILWFTKNYYLYLSIKVLMTILENVVINIRVNKDYSYIKDNNIKELHYKVKDSIISRVKALVIHRTAGSISGAIDNILISIFLGISVTGIFTNYNYILTTIKSLFSSIILSSGASVGNLLIEKNIEKNYETFKKINFLNFWLTTFTSTCLLLLIEPFIILWIGKKYLLDKLTLIVLIINYFQLMMRTSYSLFKDSAGIWIEDRFLPILQCSLNIILSIIFIKILGVAGVFIGTILSSSVVWFYSYYRYVYKELFNKNVKDYCIALTKHIIIFLSITSISYVINIFSSNIIVSLVLSLIIPNTILFLLYRNTYEYKFYKELLFKMVRKCKKQISMEN